MKSDLYLNHIKKRIAQAVSRKIYEKAKHIVYYLGKGHRFPDNPYTKLIYHNTVSKLTINCTHRGNYEELEILEGEVVVFLQRNSSRFIYRGGECSIRDDWSIDGYIPGDWEAELNRLKRSADKAKKVEGKTYEMKRRASEKKKIMAQRKAWGISESRKQ